MAVDDDNSAAGVTAGASPSTKEQQEGPSVFPPPIVHPRKSVSATDAEFLELVDTSSDRAVVNLHKSNLLRLQTEELLKETTLSIDPADSSIDGTTHDAAPKWITIAQQYVQDITRVLEHDLSLVKIQVQDPSSPFVLKSDNYRQWDDLSCGNQKLKVQPKGCTSANLGFTKPAGNAQVLPTLELRVLIPTRGLVDPKDYMKYRYFDVCLEVAVDCGLVVVVCCRYVLVVSSKCLFAFFPNRNEMPSSGISVDNYQTKSVLQLWGKFSGAGLQRIPPCY